MFAKNRFKLLPAVLLLTALFPVTAALHRVRPVVSYTVDLYDTIRSRIIPLTIYAPQANARHKGVVLFSHGYGGNSGKSYQTYSYLTEALAAAGYFVISIQHELPGDAPLAMQGDLCQTRLPNWERGVENIAFTLKTFQNLRPDLDWTNVTVAGHSNGGDMSILFAMRHPDQVANVLSLDHRRMPLPRTRHPRIGSLRGCDYPAGPGLLPDARQQKQFGITIVCYNNIRHTDMDNKGTALQHQQICRDVLQFITK